MIQFTFGDSLHSFQPSSYNMTAPAALKIFPKPAFTSSSTNFTYHIWNLPYQTSQICNQNPCKGMHSHYLQGEFKLMTMSPLYPCGKPCSVYIFNTTATTQHNVLPSENRDKGGAMGWTGVDMSTPFFSGRYSFLSKKDIKIDRYTFWPSFLSLFHPTFLGWCRL